MKNVYCSWCLSTSYLLVILILNLVQVLLQILWFSLGTNEIYQIIFALCFVEMFIAYCWKVQSLKASSCRVPGVLQTDLPKKNRPRHKKIQSVYLQVLVWFPFEGVHHKIDIEATAWCWKHIRIQSAKTYLPARVQCPVERLLEAAGEKKASEIIVGFWRCPWKKARF